MNRFIDLVEYSGVAYYFPSDLEVFTSCQIEDSFQIPDSVSDIIGISSNIRINNTYILSAPHPMTWKGSMDTVNKLLIDGDVDNIVEYMSGSTKSEIFSINYTTPFNSYITLNNDFNEYMQYNVIPYIEDIFILQHDKQYLYINVMFMLTVDVQFHK